MPKLEIIKVTLCFCQLNSNCLTQIVRILYYISRGRSLNLKFSTYSPFKGEIIVTRLLEQK